MPGGKSPGRFKTFPEKSECIVLVQQFLPFRSHPAPELMSQLPSSLSELQEEMRAAASGQQQARADQHLASQKVFPAPFGSGLP